MRKKGQLEMSITVLVLAMFFVLLFIGFIFYFRFSFESYKESESKILEDRYNVYLSHVINLPELKCSFMGVEKECLDVSKIKSFSGSDSYYKRVFENVRRIYVKEFVSRNEEYDLYRYGQGTGRVYSTPVSLYYPKEDRYGIGKLSVVVE